MYQKGYPIVTDEELIGEWNYIEHNLHKSGCKGGTDSFVKRNGNLFLNKFCSTDDMREISSSLTVRRKTANTLEANFIVTKVGGGMLGRDVNSIYVIYKMGGKKTDKEDNRYMIIGNEGSSGALNKSKYFAILHRKRKITVCELADIEQDLGKYGLDVTDVIRERSALIPCGNVAKKTTTN